VVRTLRRPPVRIAMAAASCVLLVGVSAKLIDRPVSTWVHEHLGDSHYAWFTMTRDNRPLVIGPFGVMTGLSEALSPLALGVLAIMVLAAAAGWRPAMHGRVALALSLSTLVASDINRGARPALGRTWPESWLGNNPSWIRDGVFGFFPFHGGPGWESFPSGHTAVITAPAALLWVVWPRLRPLWATTVIIDMAGLIGANYHFVSDLIGGVYLGVAVGLGMAALMLSPKDRLNWPIVGSPPPT